MTHLESPWAQACHRGEEAEIGAWRVNLNAFINNLLTLQG